MLIKNSEILKDYNVIYFIFLSFCLGNFFVNLSIVICFFIFVAKFKYILTYIGKLKSIFYISISFWLILVLSTILNSPNDVSLIFKSLAYIRFIIFPFIIAYLYLNVEKKNL